MNDKKKENSASRWNKDEYDSQLFEKWMRKREKKGQFVFSRSHRTKNLDMTGFIALSIVKKENRTNRAKNIHFFLQ